MPAAIPSSKAGGRERPNPRVLVCDEPVSALDLSIRTQVMNLFLRLQKDLGVACLFIARDLHSRKRTALQTSEEVAA